MPSAPRRLVAWASLGAALALPALAGCTDNTAATGTDDASPDGRSLSVQAGDTACTVSAGEAPSGKLTFSVQNTGAKVNEFYLLASDGLRILGEIENIGPGLTRELVVTVPPGNYLTACKPGMVGDGIRAAFAVSDSGADLAPSGSDQALVDEATRSYQAYVKDQTEQLLTKTQAFAAAYTAGRDDEARELYPRARTHWERVETVAESFGDLDPRMDAREADLAEGEAWTGWHRMEKDLWPARAKGYTPLSDAKRSTYARQLVADTQTLLKRVRNLKVSVSEIANGSRGLLDEVAKGKVTGEEEHWSRTDLWDFQANVDGARVGWEGLRPLLQKKDPALDTQLETRFASLQKLLDASREGDGFVSYDQLSTAEVKALSDAVNALSEPLSKLTAAVT